MKMAKRLILIFYSALILAVLCPLSVQAVNLKLNHKKLVMSVSDTAILKVTGNFGKKIQWKSSNPVIAKISKNGKVTAKRAGTAVITAKIRSKKLTCKITVKKNSINSSMKKTAKHNAKTYKKQIAEMLNETNRYRAKRGLSKLKLNKKLTEIACYRSVEMAREDKLSHVRQDGTRVKELMRRFGFKCHSVKENIGYESYTDDLVDIDDAADFVEIWYDSTSHRRNMMNKNAKEIGIGIGFVDERKVYYTQLFVY